VQRSERNEVLENIDDVIVDEGRLGELLAAVDDAVADGVDPFVGEVVDEVVERRPMVGYFLENSPSRFLTRRHVDQHVLDRRAATVQDEHPHGVMSCRRPGSR